MDETTHPRISHRRRLAKEEGRLFPELPCLLLFLFLFLFSLARRPFGPLALSVCPRSWLAARSVGGGPAVVYPVYRVRSTEQVDRPRVEQLPCQLLLAVSIHGRPAEGGVESGRERGGGGGDGSGGR